MCFAQGHKAVLPVRLEPTNAGFPVKCSTTESLMRARDEMTMQYELSVLRL